MAQKSPRYRLYQEFVDAYMKGHMEMTRCVRLNIQTLFNLLIFFIQGFSS